jgi:uncharacterized ubiquitin-like protein YukD
VDLLDLPAMSKMKLEISVAEKLRTIKDILWQSKKVYTKPRKDWKLLRQ